MKLACRAMGLLFMIFSGCCFGGGGFPLWAASPDFIVMPNFIRIGAFHEATKVMFRAEIPHDFDLVVDIRGEVVPEELVRKVRHWDMWMNGEDVLIKGAPSLYMAVSSDPELLFGSGPEMLWGYDAVKRRISFSGKINSGERDRFFRDFCLLKERRYLYHMEKKALEPIDSSRKKVVMRGFFKLPANMMPGSYDVTLSVVRDGHVISRKTIPIRAVMVGFPSMIALLAKEHSLFYGCAAVCIALLAGLFTGFIFERFRVGKKNGGH